MAIFIMNSNSKSTETISTDIQVTFARLYITVVKIPGIYAEHWKISNDRNYDTAYQVKIS